MDAGRVRFDGTTERHYSRRVFHLDGFTPPGLQIDYGLIIAFRGLGCHAA
jgi:hypothetical protein